MEGHGIIYTIVIGFIIGLLARAIYPGSQKAGIIVTIVLGIVGSYVASFVGASLGWYHDGQAAGFFGSIVGALIVLAVYFFALKLFTKSS
ncbi:GlsB/YeaQ/YmgE family stress response membrane protein [Aquirhabdus parva]|uniref:GlsB/YeaQ/YmgE family stress response membrane protein n=1 Tax=Aquirhabdus parva TaxID=2283318 RepID=A0A345PAL3_9GAMM|nr:GlsB/YeaQ/YmgE family stress response membrane protein [Aquirhabdus parva]AXI04322.1 GlsB/YeaQ/YmgE family stress response membrane protein [Aquirhabdus parva]